MAVNLAPVIENLVRDESIRRNKSISYVVNEALENHYMNSTLVHKKLNWIMKHMRGASEIPSDWLNEHDNIFDKPRVSQAEIDASKFPSKKKYSKKFTKKQEEPKPRLRLDDIEDVFNPESIEKYIRR